MQIAMWRRAGDKTICRRPADYPKLDFLVLIPKYKMLAIHELHTLQPAGCYPDYFVVVGDELDFICVIKDTGTVERIVGCIKSRCYRVFGKHSPNISREAFFTAARFSVLRYLRLEAEIGEQ